MSPEVEKHPGTSMTKDNNLKVGHVLYLRTPIETNGNLEYLIERTRVSIM
jgi:hypothetical protein